MILNVCRSPVIHTVALKCKKQCEKLFATTCVQIHDCYRTDVLFMNVVYWSHAVLCHNFLDRRQLLHLEGKNFLFSMMYDMLEYAGKSNLPYSGSWLDLTQIFTRLQTNRRCVLYKLHLLCGVNKLFSIVNNAPHDLSLDDNIESR